MRHVNRTRSTIAAAALAALVATGCSAPSLEAETASSGSDPVALEDAELADDDADEVVELEDATPEETATDGTAPIVDDEREPATSDQASPPPVAQTGDPLVSVPGSAPFTQVDVLDLRRDGDVVTLEFALHIEQDDSRGERVDEVFSSSDDTSSVLAKTDPDINQFMNPKRLSVSGVTLVDRSNSNRHLVLRDATSACLCTRFTDDRVDGGVYRHSAQFPAPPADVTTMTVEVPHFPSIDGVAIREAS